MESISGLRQEDVLKTLWMQGRQSGPKWSRCYPTSQPVLEILQQWLIYKLINEVILRRNCSQFEQIKELQQNVSEDKLGGDDKRKVGGREEKSNLNKVFQSNFNLDSVVFSLRKGRVFYRREPKLSFLYFASHCHCKFLMLHFGKTATSPEGIQLTPALTNRLMVSICITMHHRLQWV